MLLKNQIKFISSLKQKKNREATNLFIAEGNKIVSDLLTSTISIKQIFGVPDFFENNKVSSDTECFIIKASELERISMLTTPNDVLAICEIPKYVLNTNALNNKLSIVLDHVRDPGNLGTIIRIADWFGIENVICSSETVETFNPKVVQATMGSIGRIKIHTINLVEFLNKVELKNLPRFGAVLNGENIYTKQLPSCGLIIIGNESTGISKEIRSLLTDEISIPSFSHLKSNEGEAESLNAAIATSIICSEFRRRY